jgi:DNA-binding response OmpR family regulator
MTPGVSARSVPVIIVASTRGDTADEVAQRLRQDGAVALAAHSASGCLRVATSVGPDVVLLDSGLPPRLEKLLKAHPTSARAQLLHLSSPPTPELTLAASPAY